MPEPTAAREVATAPEPSPQGQLGAALLAMRKRSPKAPLSKLHDKMLGRST